MRVSLPVTCWGGGGRRSGHSSACPSAERGKAAGVRTRRAVGAGPLVHAQPLNVAPGSRGGECCLRLLSAVATGCVCDVLSLFGCEVRLEQGEEEEEAAAGGLPLLRAGLVFEPILSNRARAPVPILTAALKVQELLKQSL